MMISYATTLSVFLFFSSYSSLAFPGLKLREDCYENEVLLSFQLWIEDSVPYCSSILSISDSTTFVGSTKSHTYALRTRMSASMAKQSQNHHQHYYDN